MSSNCHSNVDPKSLEWVTCRYCKKRFPDRHCLSWHQANQMQCSPFDINAQVFVPEAHIITNWIRTSPDADLINEANRILTELENGDLYT